VRADGRVKILDFGLAKAIEPVEPESASGIELANSPTLTFQPTMHGLILGTAGYMSPEQAKGLPADKRADVWAFGVVLYEMLAGRRLFDGQTATEILAAVLRAEIDLDSLPAATPTGLRSLLRRCLERDPRNRLHDIADARILLDEVREGSDMGSEAATVGGPAPAPGRRLRWTAAALVIGLTAGWIAHLSLAEPGPSQEPRAVPLFRQLTRLPGGEWDPSLSADGERFVFVKEDGGDTDIFAQRVDGQRALNLTEGCEQDDSWPAISPDGRLIAFESECGGGGIFVMGPTGESLRRVSDLGYQPAWSPDGKELAVVTETQGAPTSRSTHSQLWVVRVADGERRRVGAQDAMAPSWSPDGSRIVLWGLRGESVQRDLWTIAADAGEEEAADSLVDDPPVDWAPVWAADGKWVYFTSTRGGTFNIWRLPVDPGSGEPRGQPEPLTAPSSWVSRFALSGDGRHLVFTDSNREGVLVRAPVDLATGRLAAEPEPVFEGSMVLREHSLSPDGSQIVFANEEPPQQLHVINGDGTGYRQLTTGTNRNRQGAFSPDGQWIAFQSDRDPNALMLVHPDGSGLRAVSAGDHSVSVPFWAPHGDTVAAFDTSPERGGYLIDLSAGLEAPEIIDLPAPGPETVFWPLSWSPDGSRLVGNALRSGVGLEPVYMYTLGSGAYELLPSLAMADSLQVAFAGNQHLAFLSGPRVLLADLRGGEPTVLYEARAPRTVAFLSASADGRWLSWLEQTDESDIWLMTLE
jgi:Tol biopolymer transport system component